MKDEHVRNRNDNETLVIYSEEIEAMTLSKKQKK